ncbi:MAG: hypothetical protein GYB37_07925 [Algicola sp.]|nr:hypothetical protein [Algicola sp.]
MKKSLNKISLIFCVAALFFSCEKREIPIFDIENGVPIAGFNGAFEQTKITFNPSEDTENTITIGVSTLTNTDRSVNLSIDMEKTTLSEEFYSISTLSPVIPAGSFTTDITITTIASSEDLPGASDEIVLVLNSVEDAEFGDNSVTELSILLDVKCPSVDIAALVGTYDVVGSTFAGFFGETDFTREVVAGPDENQITIIGGTYITEGADDLILTINPETGSIIAVNEDGINAQVSYGPNFYSFLPGGRVLTCVGIIEVNLDFSASISGNPHDFDLVKQP